jgi:hypothetical protein
VYELLKKWVGGRTAQKSATESSGGVFCCRLQNAEK